MKPAVALSLLLVSSGVIAAQNLEERFLIGASLMPIHACSTQFPDLKPTLNEGFKKFVKLNQQYMTEFQWKTEAKTAEDFPQVNPFTRAECDEFSRDLPNTKLDKAIGAARALNACKTKFEKAASLPIRTVIGVELEEKEWAVVAKIKKIAPNSPGALAGLLPGDIVVSYKNTKIGSGCELGVAILNSKANTPVSLVAERNGEKHAFIVTPIAIANEE